MKNWTTSVLVALALAVFGLMKLDAYATSAKEAELLLVDLTRAQLQRQNEELRDEMDRVDEAATDSLQKLNTAIEDAETRAKQAAEAGRETFSQIIDAVPDSMPELRVMIGQLEVEHAEEIAAKDALIAAERFASGVLRGQLTARDTVIVGLRKELVVSIDQILLLEDLRDPGLSNLEAVSLGAGAYVATTEVLGGSTLEGVIAGGATYLITKGGSKLLRWMF